MKAGSGGAGGSGSGGAGAGIGTKGATGGNGAGKVTIEKYTDCDDFQIAKFDAVYGEERNPVKVYENFHYEGVDSEG